MFEFRGGIQVYSTFLLRALAELHPDREIEVFLLHDRAGSGGFPANVTFHCAGGWPRPLRKARFALGALTAAALRRPSVILSTHLHFGPLAAIVRRIFRTPYWLVAHGVEAWDVKSEPVRRALCGADRVLAVSEFTRKKVAERYGIPAERTAVLANTFEEARFRPGPKPAELLERYGFAPSDTIILSVCRLDAAERHKGYDSVIAALPAVRAQVPNARYLLVGKGSDRKRLEALIAEKRLGDCVTLAGFVPDTELCDHYNLCDVFALPSSGEGFGIVFLEALACGKPVVAGSADASGEPLGGGELGVLVDPADVAALERALIAVLTGSHPNRTLREPDTLRKTISERYGASAFRNNVGEAFTSL